MASDDGDGANDVLSLIENVIGTSSADTLIGDNNANALTANDGNDLLIGNGGVDALDGGNGTDTVDYNGAGGNVNASNTASSDGDGANDTFTSIENLIGSDYDDVLTGNGSVNTLTGNDGDDDIAGGGGADTITGDAGDDVLDGDADADVLSGGVGSDTINGGTGNDIMYALDNGVSAADADAGSVNLLNGGDGNDTLYSGTGTDLLNGGDDNDTLISDSEYVQVTLLDNSFDAGTEDFTYSDGGFGGSDPGNVDVSGSYEGSDGDASNGSVEVYVDGQNNSAFSNGSGSYDASFTTSSNIVGAQITFSYRHWHSNRNDNNEDSQVYFEFDGTIYDDAGGNSFISEALGSGGTTDTGWVSVTIDLPALDAGTTYNLSLGILHTGSNRNNEDAYVRFDDVLVTGINADISTVLNGQDGLDTLTGNDGGVDTFLFEGASAFNDVDVINNFNIADGDTLNLMDLLNGHYVEATDTLTDFVQITNSGSNSIVRVDITGSGSFGAGTKIATIVGVTGLTDEIALQTAGNLIAPEFALDIIGTPAPDIIVGTGAGERIGGLESDDTISGGGGNDTLYGMSGNDTADYSSATGSVTANLSTGTASNDGDGASDVLDSIENLTGSNSGDDLTGDSNTNILRGMGGNDTLDGDAGDDFLYGGAGNDTLYGGTGTDTADYTDAAGGVTASISGGATNDGDGGTDSYISIENIIGSDFADTLTGDNATNTLNGGEGADQLNGGGGADTLYGDAGDDFLYGGAGVDELDGGAGSDTADYSSAGGSVVVDLSTNSASDDGDGSTDNFTSIENVTGSGFADTLTGDANANVLSGGGGNDTLFSSGGADSYDGGTGTDTVDYSGAASGVTANLGTGIASNDGDGSTDTFTDVEILIGSGNNDVLTGDSGANTLFGGDGGDSLNGGGGVDVLEGEAGNDTINGGDGNDIINGGDGNDALYGDNNNDTVSGGAGNDTINGGSGNDVLYATSSPVTLLDVNFDSGTEGFSYADGGFGGSDPTGTNYVRGQRTTSDGGASNGALEVTLGGINNDDISNMSGNWSETFNVADDLTDVTLTFSYRVLDSVVDTDPMDAGEDLQLYVDIDGTTYSNDSNAYFFEIAGAAAGASYDSGWVTVTLDIGALSAGNHTISFGGLYTLKTFASEEYEIRFDDIVLEEAVQDPTNYSNVLNGGAGNDTLYGSSGTDTLNGGNGDDVLNSGSGSNLVAVTELDLDFNSSADGFSYSDGGFGGSDPTGTNYVRGSHITSDGNTANGALEITLGGVNGDDISNMSGSWSETFNVAEALTGVTVTFSYRALDSVVDTDPMDSGEDLQLYLDIDGTTYSNNGNNYFTEVLGDDAGTDYDSGWTTVQLTIGALSAGNHTISLGALFTDKTWASEEYDVRFDDLVVEGYKPDTSILNVLNGQDGQDDLYGNSGVDHFLFEAASAFNDIDNIYNFSTAESDALDISDLLSGYNSGTDDITDFVQITTSGSDSILRVDTTGSASFGAGTQIATIVGVTGLTDEATLETNGNIIT